MYEFRLLNYAKCIAFIIFKVTFTHFSFQIIISNIPLKLQANRQRVTIGDQGCTLAPLILLGCLMFFANIFS